MLIDLREKYDFDMLKYNGEVPCLFRFRGRKIKEIRLNTKGLIAENLNNRFVHFENFSYCCKIQKMIKLLW